MLDLDLRGEVMLIKEFIHSDRIYSKCTEEEKRRLEKVLKCYRIKDGHIKRALKILEIAIAPYPHHS